MCLHISPPTSPLLSLCLRPFHSNVPLVLTAPPLSVCGALAPRPHMSEHYSSTIYFYLSVC
ncbi:Hypothetical protein, putative [Bodo saltans]|uniref:Uncharacterized protein n=1 Tax=Bodo saltans TaxID=75058 RepID=A0A0S4JB75_BODSA|nr:Hypothetical protein, putative [Bodo saltans]|eukprot:CUG87455.1 Hypothetical protein, putative [Bodo saltans]